MMTTNSEYLTDPMMRARFMDLSFSLYECLAELLGDLVIVDGGDGDDDELCAAYQRIDTACMNCLGDIVLLSPILEGVRMDHMHSLD